MVTTRSQLADRSATLEHTRVDNSNSHVSFLTLQCSQLANIQTQRRSTRLRPKASFSINQTLTGRITKATRLKKSGPVQKTQQIVLEKAEIDIKTDFVKPRRVKKRSLKITLTKIDYYSLPNYIQRQDIKVLRQERRLENFQGRYLPPPLRTYDNRYHFKFEHNPFHHTGFKGPSVEQQWDVYNLMKEDLKQNFNKDCFLDQPDATTNELQSGPMHMSDDLSVDNLVKVILSISTENSLAIRQHAQLCSKFTYTVNGKEVKGTVPNYHKMRLCSAEELVRALNIAGQHNLRQRAFHSILNDVHSQNVKRLQADAVVPEGNLEGATDFVPGLLSMDYLKGEGLSKQERFDLLVRFDQIAVKTGCCLLAFNLKIPVFVVDTHVHNMARFLQWIPEDCLDADKACMFLDSIMPDQLKFGLHQAFWHHRINCVRCMPRANPKSLSYQQRICPLEDLIKRDVLSRARTSNKDNKEKSKKSSTPKSEKQAGSITFLNIHRKIAIDKGYVLRMVQIDDDFGDGSRQNKDGRANFYWGQAEFTHANDIVKFEDALDAIGMSVESYEARFVKKSRSKKKKTVKAESDAEEDEDVEAEDDLEETPLDESMDPGTNDDENGEEDNQVLASKQDTVMEGRT